jgi:hypothetical protein
MRFGSACHISRRGTVEIMDEDIQWARVVVLSRQCRFEINLDVCVENPLFPILRQYPVVGPLT